jgi:hypothetical protein
MIVALPVELSRHGRLLLQHEGDQVSEVLHVLGLDEPRNAIDDCRRKLPPRPRCRS